MDLLFRVGFVRSFLWKYLDKILCEFDIDDLLERYLYFNDDDYCKLLYIIFFEFLIDR